MLQSNTILSRCIESQCIGSRFIQINLLLLLVLVCTACTHPAIKFTAPSLSKPNLSSYTGPRFRVTVSTFKNFDAAQGLLNTFGFTGIEKGITELATNILVEAGYLRVLERTLLDGVTSNTQVEVNSELFDQSTTSVKGKLLGSEYVLVGSIENIEPNVSVSEANLKVPYLLNLKTSTSQASVRLGIRLVHAQTGVILASGIGHGLVKTTGIGLQANRLPIGAFLNASSGFTSSSRTPLGFAFYQALFQAIESLAQQLKKSPWSCRVASATPPRVFIECGALHRLKKGMRFQYYSRKGEIKDAQGKVIGYDDQLNGEVILQSVQPTISIGLHQLGNTAPIAGDVVVLKQK
jgi:curli biogenesis system outer membrane secretion channel CsgG